MVEHESPEPVTGAETGTTSGIPEPGADSLSWSNTGQMFIARPPEEQRKFVGIVFWVAIAALAVLLLLYPYIDTFIEYPPYAKPFVAQLFLIFPVGIFIVSFVTGLLERHGYLIGVIAIILFIAHNLIFGVFFWAQSFIFAAGYLIISAIAWLLGFAIGRPHKPKKKRI